MLDQPKREELLCMSVHSCFLYLYCRYFKESLLRLFVRLFVPTMKRDDPNVRCNWWQKCSLQFVLQLFISEFRLNIFNYSGIFDYHQASTCLVIYSLIQIWQTPFLSFLLIFFINLFLNIYTYIYKRQYNKTMLKFIQSVQFSACSLNTLSIGHIHSKNGVILYGHGWSVTVP